MARVVRYLAKRFQSQPDRCHYLGEETAREYVSACGLLRLSRISAVVTTERPTDRILCGHCAKLRP